MKSIWLAILSCCVSFCCYSQANDSISIWKNQLKDDLELHQRKEILLKIIWYYYYADRDSVIPYGVQVLSVAQQQLDTPEQIYILTKILSNGYGILGENDQQLKYLNRALQLGEESKDALQLSIVFENYCGYYMEQANYPKALAYEQRSLDYIRRSGDTTEISYNYSTMGYIYSSLGEYSLAATYHLLALERGELTASPQRVNKYLGNVATTYLQMGQLDNAAVYYQCQLVQSAELQDSSFLAKCYLSLGSFYEKQADFESALRYYRSALSIYEKDDINNSWITLYHGLSTVYMGLNQPDKALEYINKAIALVKLFKNHIKEHEIWKSLSLLYEKTNKPAMALAAYKQYIVYRDSSFNVEKTTAFARQEMQYDFDKQAYADSLSHANEMNVNELKLQRQRTFTYSGLGGFAIVLFFAGVFFRQRNKIKKEKNRAEQSEKFKQQFLANMSHEIRTPMNVVLGMTDLVLDTPLNPQQKNYLTGIKRASSNLLHIINDILDLSKVEAGKLELEKIDFSIREVINQVHDLLILKTIDKGIELKTLIDTDVPEFVIGDPNRLNQVILNLAGNAIKFTEKGSVTIHVSKPAENDTIHFSIKDTGIGIPKEKQGKIFESFTQAHSSDSRRYGGTGLGLSISRQLIELMGGTLSVESMEGSGSTFSFTIPLPEGSIDRILTAQSSEEIDGSALNGLRILLVDDHEENRIVANDTLQSKSKVEITEASNGKEVIHLLQQQDFDVILMDVQMPVMDGYETTRQIRSTFPSPKNSIPIIALTASVIRSDLDKCRDAGMNDYVPKPFKTSELISAIAKATGRSGINNRESISNSAQMFKSTWQKKIGSVIDLGYLESFCEGDPVKMKKYIMIFLGLSPMTLMKIKESLATKDAKGIAAQLHGKRTQLNMMGMQECLDVASDLEKECHALTLDFGSIENKTDHFIQLLEQGISELKSVAESER